MSFLNNKLSVPEHGPPQRTSTHDCPCLREPATDRYQFFRISQLYSSFAPRQVAPFLRCESSVRFVKMEGAIIAAGVLGSVAGVVSVCATIWTYYFRQKNFPPGPRPWPFIGTLFYGDQFEALEEMGRKYGPVFSASKMNVKPCVFVNDFEIFKRDLKPQVGAFARRPQSGVVRLIHMDKGIVYSNDEHWQGN